MPIPDFETVLSPLLTLFADGQPRHMADVIESIANHFNLTPAERNETLATGTRRIASNVGWARTDLGKAGLIERVSRGTWKITDAGRQLLSEDHDRLTRRTLARSPQPRRLRCPLRLRPRLARYLPRRQ